ncbi:MAG: magnesium and cobalt transport protein CorA [Candidatus Solincola sediminis]|uniref:Magnesium transport protein CorA n=1 Tax=Candidatus Solincola sediminis TaxID=1797199 RepID=A0A1F2WIY3_9ACTN|nr:MAG: magnesium and cobalt transport protein CorA [Candidatus Solincola sediminis]OFW56794.1 MAG: magnesium and cobalt transport protein CorA [Candidatus Solincola sediminis]
MKIYVVDNSCAVKKISDLSGIKLGDCSLIWLDAQAPSDEERNSIQQFFGIHPLAMEVSKRAENVPRAQEFDGHMMVIWEFLHDRESLDKVGLTSLYLIMGSNYLVTIHMEDIPILNDVFDKLKEDEEPKHHHPAFFLYTIMNVSVEQFFPFVEDLQDKIDTYMENLLASNKAGDLNALMGLKHRNMSIRRTVYSLRDVVMRLASRDIPLIPDDLNVYLMDVYDRLARLSLEVESNSDLVSSSLDIHLNAVSNRLNVTMKRLTGIATFFMPATFLAGVYGMNFIHMPEYKWQYGYLYFWIIIVVIVVAMAVVAKRQDWL